MTEIKPCAKNTMSTIHEAKTDRNERKNKELKIL